MFPYTCSQQPLDVCTDLAQSPEMCRYLHSAPRAVAIPFSSLCFLLSFLLTQTTVLWSGFGASSCPWKTKGSTSHYRLECFFYLNINFSKRTAFTFFDCTSFSWGLAETAAAWRELFAKASFKFLTMTSERGVFSFLVPWLEPSGVSRIASASYIYMGRKGKGKE